MSEQDFVDDALERLEWDERKDDETPFKRLRQVTRRSALTGGAAGIAATILAACGSSSSSSSAASGGGGSAASGIFGSGKSFKFTLVNHVTTNTFFTPTQNGAQDACKLLGCSYQWTGSQTSNVGEMVNAFNAAVSAGVNGIGVSLVDQTAFNGPVQKALSAKIPVVSYNADVKSNARLAYVGQDLHTAGVEMGQHIKALLPSGGPIALFIATPGSLNIQPRIDGAKQALAGTSITPSIVATGAAVPQELTTINSFVEGHPNVKGLFAVDGGSTQGVAQAIQQHNLKGKVKGGGFDLTPVTEQLLQSGMIQFTIDQQPYLQGFLPILELYLYNVSQGLSGPADVDTGLKFVTSATVAPYTSTKSRYEGTGTSAGVQKG